jgi:hypothetical protein
VYDIRDRASWRRPIASGRTVNDDLLLHVAPLGWEHIGLTGDYVWSDAEQLRGLDRQGRGWRGVQTVNWLEAHQLSHDRAGDAIDLVGREFALRGAGFDFDGIAHRPCSKKACCWLAIRGLHSRSRVR